MKKLYRNIIIAAVCLLVVLLIGLFSAQKYYESKLNKEMHIIEAMNVNELNQILDKYKGSLLFVDHSSVNCGPCFEEMRDFVPQLQKRYKDKPITFIYICSESNYPLKSISNSVLWRRKLSKLNIKGEHYLINKEFSLKIFKQTVSEDLGEIAYYPWQFIADESGKIINKHTIRPSDSTKLYQQLDNLLLLKEK